MSLSEIRDAATDIAERATAAQSAIVAALTADAVTAQDLGALDATLVGIGADIRAARADLDAIDITEEQLYDDAAVTLALWSWERGLRHQLGVIGGAMFDADQEAKDLLSGLTRKVYVVRSGDTLQGVAARFLGDWREWPRIAEANGLAPGQPAAGTQLVIPPKR